MPRTARRKRLTREKDHSRRTTGTVDSGNSARDLDDNEQCDAEVASVVDPPSSIPESSSESNDSRPQSAASTSDSVHFNFGDDCISLPSPDPSVVSLDINLDSSADTLANRTSAGGDLSFTIRSPDFDSNDSGSDASSSPLLSISPSVSPIPPSPFKTPESGYFCASAPHKLSHHEALLHEVKGKLQGFLRDHWVSLVHKDELHIMFLSRSADKMTQRQLSFKCDGSVQMKVHCKTFRISDHIKKVLPARFLQHNSIPHFVDRVVQIINVVCTLEICCGVPHQEYKKVWPEIDCSVVDLNPYKEHRYSETLRSVQCELLVPYRKWRCSECNKLVKVVQRKGDMASKTEVHPFTANAHLSKDQVFQKLEGLKSDLRNTKRQLARLNQKVKHLLKTEGVEIDEDVASDLKFVLDSQNLSEAQKLFLQQQKMAVTAKSARGRRWHPAIIRFALSILMRSPSAYGAIYDSGMIQLPSKRTLFDYTHFKPVRDGIDYDVMEIVSKKVQALCEPGKEYKKFHVLMCDEMYISKNLVYKKSTGKVIGYVHLESVDVELTAIENYLSDSGDTNVKLSTPTIASKVLTYLIKGIASDVKEAVAHFAVDKLTKENLYRWTWEVITKLERAGIAIIAFTSDGGSSNRSFMKINKPASEGEFIFDTINKAAPERNLYFIADVPHLLKTMRNCFYSSCEKRYHNKQTGKMMLRRRLEKNNEKILWSTIINVYNQEVNKTLRLCPKLNVQNVFLNSYSKMKVKYAAQVMSRSVAQLLEDRKWPNTKETVEFIRRTNDFFDMLNGAHTQQGVRSRNNNLLPYRSVSDERFGKLEDFLNYLKEWKNDAESKGTNVTVDVSWQGRPGNEESICAEDDLDDPDVEEDSDPASIRQLSKPTLEGIYITVKGFTGAVQFLLGCGVNFINARVFCQDPLEQFFSKQRSKCGGSSHPNFDQFRNNARSISQQGQLGTKKSYRGNTQVEDSAMKISDEPLPKRKKT